MAEYGHLLEAVGFESVVAEDRSDGFRKVLTEELQRMQSEQGRLQFLQGDYYTEADVSELVMWTSE